MKRLIAISFVLILSLMIFTGCSMDPTDADNLIGTKWEVATLGTGVRLVFDSATTVTESIIAAGVTIDETEYVYTYDALTQTGMIDGTWDFEISIDGTELTYVDYVFEYKPF